MNHQYLNWMEAAACLQRTGEPFVLVTVLSVTGSAPRPAGTKMLVSADTVVETIGGGHLEHSAIQQARQALQQGGTRQWSEEYPLGARLGQCCGGRVTLLFEAFAGAEAHIAVFGAGHVGRALVGLLAQLPVRVTWIDSRKEEFPNDIPAGVVRKLAAQPEDEVVDLPAGFYAVVLTHLHPLDYAITEAVLKRGDAAYLGVIGSQTKARRFAMRLKHRGFSAQDIEFMRCPVGAANVPGKRPMEVAVAIAAELIALYHGKQNAKNQHKNLPAPVLNIQCLQHGQPPE